MKHPAHARLQLILAPATPIIQAPMAGVSTPALAAAVSAGGGLGSVAVGAQSPAAAARTLAAVRELTVRPVNVNVFTHAPPRRDAALEARWIERMAPHFARFGAAPPETLDEPYRSFIDDDDAMLAVLLEAGVQVVSFHFGAPRSDQVRALKANDVLLLGTATSLAEARRLLDVGVDVIVAQGFEAGGHRGVFAAARKAPHEAAVDADEDECLETETLVRTLVHAIDAPVVAAGGLMDGADIARMLAFGACAVQLGTAFVACPESSASARHRARLLDREPLAERSRDKGPGSGSAHTAMTSVISGRPARGFVESWEAAFGHGADAGGVPAYPVAYDAGKALAAAATAAGSDAFDVLWAGTGAARARSLPASELMQCLAEELRSAQAKTAVPHR